ncbi:MAG TPA: hypothetical protein VHU83_06895 [Bryobacteraceae bacterium]|jgi:hypothetical protein|nr:hypothetical protein [Bryobacteraceae bacterium]
MTVTDIAQYISDGLELALIIRLLLLRLHSVYRVFCAFLLFDLFSSAAFFVATYAHLHYLVVWMVLRPLAWVLSLWMVYALLDAMLVNLPGILRLSRKILNGVFVAALIIALFTARPEYAASDLAASPAAANRAYAVVLVLERSISSAALLALFAMLVFIWWFPVQMPRNLVAFSAGFAAFFAITTSVWLAHTYVSHLKVRFASHVEVFLHAACFAYWLLVLNRAGETKPVRVGHSWGPAEQQRLVGQLEAMNDALLRASRRENYREL